MRHTAATARVGEGRGEQTEQQARPHHRGRSIAPSTCVTAGCPARTIVRGSVHVFKQGPYTQGRISTIRNIRGTPYVLNANAPYLNMAEARHAPLRGKMSAESHRSRGSGRAQSRGTRFTRPAIKSRETRPCITARCCDLQLDDRLDAAVPTRRTGGGWRRPHARHNQLQA